MNVVLLEPEIPQNTGNIGRTCCATGTKLHLIEPMGFRINEKSLKRAGMDYWENLDVTIYDSYNDFLEQNPNAKRFYEYLGFKVYKRNERDEQGNPYPILYMRLER